MGLNAPILSYIPAVYTYTKGTTISTVAPINTGGEVSSWAINATLPSGLFLWDEQRQHLGHAGHDHANHDLHRVGQQLSGIVIDDDHAHGERPSAKLLLRWCERRWLPPGCALSQSNHECPSSHNGEREWRPVSCSSSPSLPSGITLSSSASSRERQRYQQRCHVHHHGNQHRRQRHGFGLHSHPPYGGALTITPQP